MKTILLNCILICLVVSAAAAADSRNVAQSAPSSYLSVYFYHGSGAASGNQFGSQSGGMSGTHGFSGSYTVRADGSTMLAGGVTSEEPPAPVLYELYYNVMLEQDGDTPILQGVIYSLDIDGGETVLGGQRQVINTPLTYDEPFDLHFAPAKGRPLTIRFLLQTPAAKAESEQVVYGDNTLTLKSYCNAPGNTQKMSSTQPLVRTKRENRELAAGLDTYQFETQFTTGPQVNPSQALVYRVTVEFTPPLNSKDLPPRTTMKLTRQYMIDTLIVSMGKPTPDKTTGSVYIKDVELRQGKQLQLVFPSDSDSLRGFLIADTLVINP